ncbi:MAG: DnaJ family domain-containing protein [Chloroflexota bacterium]
MSLSKKEKEQQRQQLAQTRAKLEQRRFLNEHPAPLARPHSEAERQTLVEQRIQEAMAAGVFDHLPGKGQPLDLNSNPYLEPGQELAFGLLKNNGFAPDWIERDKEIRREIEALRSRLRSAWQRRRDRADVACFEAHLVALNRKIDDFNLIVPIISKQRARLSLERELRRLEEDLNRKS